MMTLSKSVSIRVLAVAIARTCRTSLQSLGPRVEMLAANGVTPFRWRLL